MPERGNMELQEIETKIKALESAKNELLKDQRKQDALNAVSSDENGNLVLNIWLYDHFLSKDKLAEEFIKDGCAIIPFHSAKNKEYLVKYKVTVERL